MRTKSYNDAVLHGPRQGHVYDTRAGWTYMHEVGRAIEERLQQAYPGDTTEDPAVMRSRVSSVAAAAEANADEPDDTILKVFRVKIASKVLKNFPWRLIECPQRRSTGSSMAASYLELMIPTFGKSKSSSMEARRGRSASLHIPRI